MIDKPVIDLINDISEKSGKTKDEINLLVKAKVDKFSGLLTEQGAAFMVGKELGVSNEKSLDVKVSELEEGMKGIEIKGNVEAVFPAKEFERNGKKGKLQSIILADGTGEVRLTLWNDQVDQYDLTRGSEVIVDNAVVSIYNEKKQLGLGFNGTLKVLKRMEEKFEKLSELKGGMNSISVLGKMLRRFPVKEFDKGDRKGKLCNFQFGDETALLRATAWNEKADEISGYNEGDALELTGAYTKDGMFGVELHIGYSTRVKKSDKELPGIKEILKESVKEKKINQLVDNQTVSIKGKVIEIVPGNLSYLVCSKCGKKLNKLDGGIVCEACGEVEPDINAVLSVWLEDDTGKIRVTMFGEQALKLLGMNKDELKKELDLKTAEMIIEEQSESLLKEVEVYGYSRESKFSGETEFMVKELF